MEYTQKKSGRRKVKSNHSGPEQALGNTTRNRVPKLIPKNNKLVSNALESKEKGLIPSQLEMDQFGGFIDRWLLQNIMYVSRG